MKSVVERWAVFFFFLRNKAVRQRRGLYSTFIMHGGYNTLQHTWQPSLCTRGGGAAQEDVLAADDDGTLCEECVSAVESAAVADAAAVGQTKVTHNSSSHEP